MTLLNKIFGSKSSEENKSSINWIQLTNASQFSTINSSEKPVVIFKHSTRCSISSMVLRRFERDFDIDTDLIDMYFLDLIANRELSNKITELYGVRHESPQLLLIRNGKVATHSSHSGINALALEDYLS